MNKLFPLSELDRVLAPAAQAPERFEALAQEWIERLDRDQADLEIRDPQSWRKGEAPLKTSFAQQFKADVDLIITLGREEEAALARRIEFARLRQAKAEREHGATARVAARRALELHALRSEMVERNLYLVLINVERYAQLHSSRLDLIQEGCVSLFRAVDGFDWRRGLLFRTYAVHWLNQAFRNFLYNHGHTVRVPVYLQKAMKRIHQASMRLGDAHATPEQLAPVAELEASLISSALGAARTSFSLDADSDEREEGARLRDLLVDGNAPEPYQPTVEEVSLESGLGAALATLNDRERLVLQLRFGLGQEREHTLAEVADRLRVSVERVRQIQVRALTKLGTPTLRRELEPFLN